MSALKKNEIKSAINQVDDAKKQIDYSDPKNALDLSDRINKEPSSVLYGALGITTGATLGTTLGIIGGVTIVATGGAGALIGGIIAVILWRGKSFQRLERLTAKTQHRLNFLKEEMEYARLNNDTESLELLKQEYKNTIKLHGVESSQFIVENTSSLDKVFDKNQIPASDEIGTVEDAVYEELKEEKKKEEDK
ncbi:hypothetical protein [Spirosoma jeollabukense]